MARLWGLSSLHDMSHEPACPPTHTYGAHPCMPGGPYQPLTIICNHMGQACVRRGLTLVDVYGGYSTIVKVATLMMRKSIYAKFDKVRLSQRQFTS